MTQETCPHGVWVEYCCWDGKLVMMCIIWRWQWWTDFSCHCFLSSEAEILGVPGTWVQYYLGNCVVRFILRPESQYNYKCYRFQQSTHDKHLPFKTLSIDCQPSVRQRSQNEDSPNYICDRFPMPLQCHKQQIPEYPGHSIPNPISRICARYYKLL